MPKNKRISCIEDSKVSRVGPWPGPPLIVKKETTCGLKGLETTKDNILKLGIPLNVRKIG